MHNYTIALQQKDQSLILVPEVINPHRRINQYTGHALAGSGRRRGLSGICGAAPPRATSRFADWTRPSVLTASRITSAFSIPESTTYKALSNNESSIVSVVLICSSSINHHNIHNLISHVHFVIKTSTRQENPHLINPRW